MEKIKSAVSNPIEEKKDAAAQAAVAQAAYQANFKFKAAGKEHEIPEFLRSVIKDQKTEKYMQELFEKAYGLPTLKERFQETKSQFQELSQTHNYVMGTIQEAQQAYRSGDLDTVFELFKIDPNKVLNWAVKQVEYSQMPPEQRQLIEAQRAEQRRNAELMKQQQYMTQEQMETQTRYIGEMLNLVLERPDYQQISQSYDSRKGRPGAFRDLVAQIGESEYALTRKVLSPLEAVKKAVDLLGEMPGSAQQPAAAAPAQTQATPQAAPAKKQTLPNLAEANARSNMAPAKAKYRSIDDLKRRHQELLGSN